MIRSKKLSKLKNISHGFFGSNGGVSKGIYKSLNCGLGSEDSKKDIKKNLLLVLKKIKSKNKNIYLPKQVHSNKFCILTNSSKKKKIECDAVITKEKNIPIGVLTADCAPIILYDPKKNIISVVHAGWRGALNGIVKKVIKFFIYSGSKPSNIIAVIGPCISQNNYEIKEDFLKRFLTQSKRNKVFFKFSKNKILFSLKKYLAQQIKKLGIKKIEIIKKDTFSSNNSYFSARRSLKKKEDDYGRNISLIMIN